MNIDRECGFRRIVALFCLSKELRGRSFDQHFSNRQTNLGITLPIAVQKLLLELSQAMQERRPFRHRNLNSLCLKFLNLSLAAKTARKSQALAVRPGHGGWYSVGATDKKAMGVESTPAIFVQRAHYLRPFLPSNCLLTC